jgi:aspartokinase-like uncharacterized kinase
MTILKVGGSLYSWPGLKLALQEWLSVHGTVLIVPGGGAAADAVRAWHQTHALTESTAHWAALATLTAAKVFLEELVDGAATVLDAEDFCRHDDRRPNALPHSWAVTSDSIAARVAELTGAEKLVLWKSVNIPPGTPWREARAKGWVDQEFPTVAQRLRCPVVFECPKATKPR